MSCIYIHCLKRWRALLPICRSEMSVFWSGAVIEFAGDILAWKISFYLPNGSVCM